ncbi:MAG: TIGR02221 family CRISPR-associated protein, partial [Kamptonema sp. SIO4C4]|nr:TIGR02221 family CRISPR-associated protein [Kamptonema sp. SIO4C4]
MQLLTVLGTGKYTKTCYNWQDQQVETRYVAKALCDFFQPDQVTV